MKLDWDALQWNEMRIKYQNISEIENSLTHTHTHTKYTTHTRATPLYENCASAEKMR